MSLTFHQYQKSAKETAIYPNSGEERGLLYCALGLAGEAGEVANLIKKGVRDGWDGVKDLHIQEELGDVLWYLSALTEELSVFYKKTGVLSLQHIAEDNLQKLARRKREGTLKAPVGGHR
jgi:NTP pyrophosphatase (non-canonical NTP hydrolase)